MADIPPARNDLLTEGYAFGSNHTDARLSAELQFLQRLGVQWKKVPPSPRRRGYRGDENHSKKRVLIVDDNLIGVSTAQIERAKELFRAMIHADLRKQWIGQVTINFADDEELLARPTGPDVAACSSASNRPIPRA